MAETEELANYDLGEPEEGLGNTEQSVGVRMLLWLIFLSGVGTGRVQHYSVQHGQHRAGCGCGDFSMVILSLWSGNWVSTALFCEHLECICHGCRPCVHSRGAMPQGISHTECKRI